MKYILKLNMMSAIYALLIFCLVQILGNFYRIARLTGWEIFSYNLPAAFTLTSGGSLADEPVEYPPSWVAAQHFDIRKATYRPAS